MRSQLDHLAGEQVQRPSGAARRRVCAGGRYQQGLLLAGQLAFGAGAQTFAQSPLQVALHEPPFGAVHRRAADADTGSDLLVADAGVRRQQDLRSLEFARRLQAPAQKGSEFIALVLGQGHAITYIHGHLLFGGAVEATLATGTAEREAAAAFSQRLPKGPTLGADKGYDAEAFVEGLKARGIEPHIAINGTVSKHGKARKTAVPSEVAASVPPGL